MDIHDKKRWRIYPEHLQSERGIELKDIDFEGLLASTRPPTMRVSCNLVLNFSMLS